MPRILTSNEIALIRFTHPGLSTEEAVRCYDFSRRLANDWRYRRKIDKWLRATWRE